MRIKKYILDKLIEMGKKHKLLVYPSIALVSIVSFIFNLMEKCIEKPKRVALVSLAMVFLILQAVWITTLASDMGEEPIADDMAESVTEEEHGLGGLGYEIDTQEIESLEPASEEAPALFNGSFQITYHVNGDNVYQNGILKSDFTDEYDGSGSYTIFAETLSREHFEFVGWYTDVALSNGATEESITVDGVTDLYAKWNRIGCNVTITAGSRKDDVLTDEVVSVTFPDSITLSVPERYRDGQDGYYVAYFVNVNTNEQYEVGAVVPITSAVTSDLEFAAVWSGNQYTVEYYKDDTVNELLGSQTHTYGETGCTLYSQDAFSEPLEKAGYEFLGWIASDTQVLYDKGVPLPECNLTTQKDGVVKVYPKWGISEATFSTAAISNQFNTKLEAVISIYPKNDVENASGRCYKSELKSVDDSTDISAKLTAIGISVDTTIDNKISVHEMEGIKKVPGNYNFVVIVKGYDGEQLVETVERNFTVGIGKTQLQVTGLQTTTKLYDSTPDISVGRITVSGMRQEDIDRISVAVDYNSGYAKFVDNEGNDDANVGTGKAIALKGLYLNDNWGDFYEVPDEIVIPAEVANGEITKRTIYLETYPVISPIKSGATPNFGIREVDVNGVAISEDNPNSAIQRNDTFDRVIIQALRNEFLCEYGTTKWSSGNYPISIAADFTTQNYDPKVIKNGTLVVNQDALATGDYKVSGIQSEERDMSDSRTWYVSPASVSSKKEGYDVIAKLDPSSPTLYERADNHFASAVQFFEEETGVEQFVQLGNVAIVENNRAVTDKIGLKVYVDTTAPVADTANMTYEESGKFFSFGSFFTKTVKITLPIVEQTSGIYKFCYTINGEVKEATIQNSSAVFEVPLKYNGEIAYYILDKAGNKTNTQLISKEGSKVWVVENDSPIVESIQVRDYLGNAVVGTDTWHKDVTVTINASDADAGINKMTWNIERDGAPITGANVDQVVTNETTAITNSYEFSKTFSNSGIYKVTGVIEDNAGNETTTDPVEFKVDGVSPVITLVDQYYDDDWEPTKNIQFAIEENESGILYTIVQRPDGNVVEVRDVINKTNTYEFTATVKGNYTITTCDFAGNLTKKTVTIQKISAETPEEGGVIIDPSTPDGENGWYITNPTVTIIPAANTSDGARVTTYYRYWKSDDEPDMATKAEGEPFQLPSEGEWKLRVWSVSKSGVESESKLYNLNYDTTAPAISDFKGVLEKKGTVISFAITDTASKLDTVSITCGSVNMDKTVSHNADGTSTVSFIASAKSEYTIIAKDKAGNESEAVTFMPMLLKSQNITNLKQKAAKVSAVFKKGTYAITDCKVEYMKADGAKYIEVSAFRNYDELDGTMTVSYPFTGLEPNTKYVYRITTSSEIGESIVTTGSFQTLSTSSKGANIFGKVIDENYQEGDEALDVTLYAGDTCMMTEKVENNEYFKFSNVQDGVYSVYATNGEVTRSVAVVINNGDLAEPTVGNEIVITLQKGYDTKVEVLGAGTPKISVTGLEKLFADSSNFGTSDQEIIDNGGVVQFKFSAALTSEAGVPNRDLAALQSYLKKNQVVSSYLTFTITKNQYDDKGNLLLSTKVTEIGGGASLRIVVPLNSDIANKNDVQILRIHGGSVSKMNDLDSVGGTYTIDSSMFSTYAITYTKETKKTTEEPTSEDTQDPTSEEPSTEKPNPPEEPTTAKPGKPEEPTTAGNTTEEETSTQTKKQNVVVTGTKGGTPATGDNADIKAIAVLGAACVIILATTKKKKH